MILTHFPFLEYLPNLSWNKNCLRGYDHITNLWDEDKKCYQFNNRAAITCHNPEMTKFIDHCLNGDKKIEELLLIAAKQCDPLTPEQHLKDYQIKLSQSYEGLKDNTWNPQLITVAPKSAMPRTPPPTNPPMNRTRAENAAQNRPSKPPPPPPEGWLERKAALEKRKTQKYPEENVDVGHKRETVKSTKQSVGYRNLITVEPRHEYLVPTVPRQTAANIPLLPTPEVRAHTRETIYESKDTRSQYINALENDYEDDYVKSELPEKWTKPKDILGESLGEFINQFDNQLAPAPGMFDLAANISATYNAVPVPERRVTRKTTQIDREHELSRASVLSGTPGTPGVSESAASAPNNVLPLPPKPSQATTIQRTETDQAVSQETPGGKLKISSEEAGDEKTKNKNKKQKGLFGSVLSFIRGSKTEKDSKQNKKGKQKK